MIERRLRDGRESWFPSTPSLAPAVIARLPARPDSPTRRLPRRALVIAVAALVLAGTALAASVLDLVPGVRIQRVDDLPELGYVVPPFGRETTVERARGDLPFELTLPEGLGEPDRVLVDRDRGGAPVVTAVYGTDLSARLILTQWPASYVLFDKLLRIDTRAEYVDVHGAPGHLDRRRRPRGLLPRALRRGRPGRGLRDRKRARLAPRRRLVPARDRRLARARARDRRVAAVRAISAAR